MPKWTNSNRISFVFIKAIDYVAEMFGVRILLFGVFFLGSSVALSQPVTENRGFRLDTFFPSYDAYGILTTEGAKVGDHLDGDMSLWFDYAHDSLVLRSLDNAGNIELFQPLVEHRLGFNLAGSIALFDRLRAGLRIHGVGFQSRDLDEPLVANPQALEASGLGDLWVMLKGQILKSEKNVVDLALGVDVSVPTHTPSLSYLGDEVVNAKVFLALAKEIAGFRAAFNFGYHYRPERQIVDVRVGQNLYYNLGLGYSFARQGAPVTLEASLFGATRTEAPFENISEVPLELAMALGYDINENWGIRAGGSVGILDGFGTPQYRVFLGVQAKLRNPDRDGDGIKNAEDSCVREAEDFDYFEDVDGCPEIDNDGDGIPDDLDGAPFEAEDLDGFEDDDGVPEDARAADKNSGQKGSLDGGAALCKFDPIEDLDGFEDGDGCEDPDNDQDQYPDFDDLCPDAAEDFDGFEDADGCPELDNDRDGILDSDDQCPLAGEVINGVEDSDGCPDIGKSLVKLSAGKVEILEKVYFDTGKDLIQKRSYGVLNQVISVLKANPQILAMRIEGHTDSRGREEANLNLSEKRASSVLRFLLAGGLDASRLSAQGFGELKPLASNSSARGREENRRVEFVITEMKAD